MKPALRSVPVAKRVLDPLDRASEILFGVVMVLTFTGSISIAEGGESDTRSVLIGALACNLAWGIVDAVMYIMANVAQRARALSILRTVRESADAEVAHRLILSALPSPVAAAISPSETETLRRRLRDQPTEPSRLTLDRQDLMGAAGVFLLVTTATLPPVVPFLVLSSVKTALRTSNAVAMIMLFGAGWQLGTHSGRPGWRVGLAMVAIGVVLVAITIALGG